MKKFREYHVIREKLRHELRHPGRALDLKAKDLIGHLLVYLINDQSECLVCYLFLHWINSFFTVEKKIALLLTNQNAEMFQCILLASEPQPQVSRLKWQLQKGQLPSLGCVDSLSIRNEKAGCCSIVALMKAGHARQTKYLDFYPFCKQLSLTGSPVCKQV